MKRLSIYCTILFALILTSCNKEPGHVMGVTEYYPSFLFYKYEPVIMTQTLEFDFNEDAKRYIKSDILLEVVEKDSDGKLQSLDGKVKVYKNGQECNKTIVPVSLDEETIDLGIEFTAEAELDKYYNLYLIESGRKQLDELILIDVEDAMYVLKKDANNPLKEGLIYGIIILLIVSVVWYILSRFILWPSTPFGRISIDYNDGMGDNTVRMYGKYELILTNDKNKKDSFFAKLFKGSRQYEYNDFWTHPITIKKGYKRGAVSVMGLRTFSLEGEKIRKETFVISNENGDEVKIITS